MADQNTNDHSSSSAPATATACSGSSSSVGETNSTSSADQSRAPLAGLYSPGPSGGTPPVDLPTIIAGRLMNPPAAFRSVDHQTVTIAITWAVGVVGPENFESTRADTRHSLRRDVELYNQLQDAGLSSEIFEWLKHGEDTITLPASHFGLR